ncbi:MAG: hypothetical protein ACPG3T_07015, partial [Pseudomonadales bacterium]
RERLACTIDISRLGNAFYENTFFDNILMLDIGTASAQNSLVGSFKNYLQKIKSRLKIGKELWR